MRFLYNLFKYRRLQVHILTLFTILIAGFAIVSTRFTYNHYYRDMNDLAIKMIQTTDDRFSEKMNAVKQRIILVLEMLKGSVETKAQATGQDENYDRFLLNVLKSEPVLTSIMIASVQGDYFSVVDLQHENACYFYSDPHKPLPEGSRYVVRTVFKQGRGFVESRKYLDVEGNVLAQESISPVSYDFALDPWAQQMMKSPELSWEEEELPRGKMPDSVQKVPGVTVSDVLFNLQGEMSGFISIGVTLREMSDFIREQKIAQNGFAVILDSQGNIKIPMHYGSNPVEVFRKNLIANVYPILKDKNSGLSFTEGKDRYLFSAQEAVIHTKEKWLFVVVVPFNDFLGNFVKTENQVRVVAFVIFIICGIITYVFSRNISRPIVKIAQELDRIREFDFVRSIPIRSNIKEIFDLERSANTMRTALQSFARYVPKEIVRTLIKYGDDVHLGGKECEITIMFSDVRDFTSITENLPIEELMRLLSDYFDVISKAVLQQEGTIDKYIGDSLMAFWGAPIKKLDHAERACLACLQCLVAICEGKKWYTRFGVHTGDVIVGNIGTTERINYTVIGDAVNVASRLQAMNKEYQTSIIISEVVLRKIGDKFVTRPLDFVAVKGKIAKLKIFELMGTVEGPLAATKEQVELSRLFTQGYKMFEAGKLQEAKKCFLETEKYFPADGPTKKYLERLKTVE